MLELLDIIGLIVLNAEHSQLSRTLDSNGKVMYFSEVTVKPFPLLIYFYLVV